MTHPMRLLVLGFGLLAAGWIVLFLMVLNVIGLSYTLSFAAYVSSVLGLAVGMYGLAGYRRRAR